MVSTGKRTVLVKTNGNNKNGYDCCKREYFQSKPFQYIKYKQNDETINGIFYIKLGKK